jgi:predicted nicotinamide N-methyase
VSFSSLHFESTLQGIRSTPCLPYCTYFPNTNPHLPTTTSTRTPKSSFIHAVNHSHSNPLTLLTHLQWDAGLHLSTYLSLHPTLVSHKTILELGCGTGLVSILCAKYLHATHVLATDGSPETLVALNTSLYLNELSSTPSTPSSSQETTNPKISTRELIWGHLLSSGEFDSFSSFLSSKSSNSNSASSAGDLDLVLAADVLYSPEIIPPFIATLEDLFDLYPAVEVLIASTMRNRATYSIFTEMCERKRWEVERVEGFEILERREQKGPWYGELEEEIEISWVRRGK